MSPHVPVLSLVALLHQLLALTLTLELPQQAGPLHHHHHHHHHPRSQDPNLDSLKCRRPSSHAQRFDHSPQALVTDAVLQKRAADPQHLVSAPQNVVNQP